MPEVFVIDGVEAQEPLAKNFSGAPLVLPCSLALARRRVFVIDGVEAQEPLAKIFSGAIICARSHHAHRELVNTQSCNR